MVAKSHAHALPKFYTYSFMHIVECVSFCEE